MIRNDDKKYVRRVVVTKLMHKRSLRCLTNTRDSPAEIQDYLAIASIENVFVYSNRYGHSDLKSD